jgi:hypothetical protein
MSLAPTFRQERTRNRFTIIVIAALAVAILGTFAWRTSVNAGNPDYFDGTSNTQVNGISGTVSPNNTTQNYSNPSVVFVDGAGTNISSIAGGSEAPDDGGWEVDSTTGWSSLQSFANFRKWRLNTSSPANVIVNPPTGNIVSMNPGAIMRVTLYSDPLDGPQSRALVQINGTYTDIEWRNGVERSVTRTFLITFTASTCGSYDSFNSLNSLFCGSFQLG